MRLFRIVLALALVFTVSPAEAARGSDVLIPGLASRMVAADGPSCSRPAIDVRITVTGAAFLGEPCKPILQRSGKSPIVVKFDIDRIDPLVYEAGLLPGYRYELRSYAMQGLALSREVLAQDNQSFSVDPNVDLPNANDDQTEAIKLNLGYVGVHFIIDRFDLVTGDPAGPLAFDKAISVEIPFAIYKLTASWVEIDSYSRTMTVGMNDVVIEGPSVRLVGRSGATVVPAEAHVVIDPPQTTTDADGLARFKLYPYPPFDNKAGPEGGIYLGSFTFTTDLIDKIRPKNAAVYFGIVQRVVGDVRGVVQGDIAAQSQSATLGKSTTSGTGNQQYPSLEMLLNDRTLATLASRNDALEGSTISLGLDEMQVRRITVGLPANPTGQKGQTWFQWGLQRVALNPVVGATPWGFVVKGVVGLIVNIVLDRSLYEKKPGSRASVANDRTQGTFRLSGSLAGDGAFTVDNAFGSSPAEVRGSSGALVVVPPASRLSIDTSTGNSVLGPLPPVCDFPHGIDLQLASGQSLGNLSDRNPALRVAHTPCRYLEETIQLWIDGSVAHFDMTPASDYTYLTLHSDSFLSPGRRVLRASMVDQDGVSKEVSRELVVANDAGIDAALPIGLSAIAGRTSVGLRWLAGDPATVASYKVYRRLGSTPITLLTSQPLTVPLYFDSTLPVGATGSYSVTAISVTGRESPGSAVVSAALVPTGTLATPPIATDLSLGSNAGAANLLFRSSNAAGGVNLFFQSAYAAGWKIERSVNAGGPFQHLAGQYGLVTTTSARDTEAEAGKSYWYRITSIGVDGAIGVPAIFGPMVSSSSSPSGPPSVRGFNQDNRAIVSWNPAPESDIAGYNVYRATLTEGFTKLTQAPGTGTTFSEMLPETALPHWYRITAVDKNGNESQPSTAVSISYSMLPGRLYLPINLR